MTTGVKRVLLAAALGLTVLYLGDCLLIELRIHEGRKPFGTVRIESYSTVPEKNNKMEFFYGDPEDVECVHALFPHFGEEPCWARRPAPR